MPGTRPLALVTGASRGIGLELAHLFARDGYDLVVNAEDDAIDAAATALLTHGVEVAPVRADLATADGVAALHAALPRTPDAVALNAGVGQGGSFLEGDLDGQLRLIDLNVRGTVHLARLLLPDMVHRGEGKVLFTSSIASMMPGSYQALYNASKSFVQSFAEAVADELSDSPVTVTSLMPGPTETDFFRRAGLPDSIMGRLPKDDPAEVARQGYEALMAGRTKVVAGSTLVKLQGLATAVVPDQVKAMTHRFIAKPLGR
jgi:short-subunit dehydrogenase